VIVVHVDLVGPLEGDYYCLTAIERQFRWLEVMMQHGRTSATTALSFERCWLCRYPRPRQVIHDRGPEFMGEDPASSPVDGYQGQANLDQESASQRNL